jgi:serine/threonine protein kinase
LFKSKGDHTVKIVDFGIAGMCAGSKKDKVDAGSIAYMPPEALKGQAKTDPSIDVWAIGIMYYAMLFGHLPWWGDTEDEFVDKIINAPLKFDPSVPITAECKDLLKGMMNKDPEKRYQLMDIMTMPYFIMDEYDLEDRLKVIEE